MITKEDSPKIINFMTPEMRVFVLGNVHLSHRVKLHYFFRYNLLHSWELIRKPEHFLMMTKEWSIKTVNFMNPGTGVLILERGHIGHTLKMHYFFKIVLVKSWTKIRQSEYIVLRS